MLGSTINSINNLAVYFVGGILLYAYTTASGGILENLIKPWIDFGSSTLAICSTVFVLVFSFFVWHSTRIVDRISVLLIVFMGFTFIFSTYGLATNISLDTLLDIGGKDTNYAKYAVGMFPVALTSFGYHHSVCALTLYLLWIFSIFGNLPRDQFAPVIASDGNLDILLNALGGVIESNTVKQMINAFSIAAILSSFIGVGLGVFDYLADFFKFDNCKIGRTKSWAVTFLPPLIMSILFPLGFLKAIGYAGAVATIWTCIIPALLAYKSRKINAAATFRVCGGNGLIIFIALFGVFVAIFHFLAMFDYLPVFKG